MVPSKLKGGPASAPLVTSVTNLGIYNETTRKPRRANAWLGLWEWKTRQTRTDLETALGMKICECSPRSWLAADGSKKEFGFFCYLTVFHLNEVLLMVDLM